MSYSTTKDIWKNLGKDAYTKVRSEIVGTGNGSTSSWDLKHDNIISGSLTLYTGGSIVDTGSYSLNLDDGKITSFNPASDEITVDYDYGDLSDSLISQMISASDSLIDMETGRNFNNNSGSVEYLSVEDGQDVFFLKNYPITYITSIELNTSAPTETPNWSTSAGGLGNDYIANSEDLSLGRIRFIDNYPNIGQDIIKVTYNYGYSSVPPLAQELSVLLTMRQMINSSLYKSIFKGYDNFTPVRLAEIDIRIEELKRLLKKTSIELV